MNCNTTHYRANSSSVPGDPTDAARVSAVKELLDRAHGKPAQAIVGDEDQPIKTIVEFAWAGLSGNAS